MRKLILAVVMVTSLLTGQAQQMNSGLKFNEEFKKLDAIENQTEKEKKIAEFLKSDVEDENLIPYYYYHFNKNDVKANEIKAIVVKKFPKGRLAISEKYQGIMSLQTLDEKEAALKKLREEYPGPYATQIAQHLAREFALLGDTDKMVYYADMAGEGMTDGRGNRLSKSKLYAPYAAIMIRSNPDAAQPFLKQAADEARANVDDAIQKGFDKGSIDRIKSTYFAAINTYVRALTAGKNPEKGYEQAHELYTSLVSDTSVDERTLSFVERDYAQTLIATNRYKEAFPIIEKVIKSGLPAEQLKEKLKPAYVAAHGSEEGFENYQAGLLAEQDLLILEEINKMAVREASHDFELSDVDGKKVRLSDLKGKVVVLDFWATWCGPCKASFPSMQLAVNKYKDDPNVVFLFLHTWEKNGGNATAEAKKYVVDNNYTFRVLMDLRDPSTRQSAVASAYKVNGIPTKIIIDTKGDIRFITSGFSSQEDVAVKELSLMIEQSKS
ncbi:redoxin domain-containing protein [Sphingobacterium sp. LRF_L2]|uniref:TlpA family protein disulfide reductase n=1 Tax=Sphingobacterium sp. LRF_L2 TaxID=3369421 RepID=UPI003F5FF687